MKLCRSVFVLLIAAAAAIAGGCGSDAAGPDSPEIRVVSDINRADTIDARPPASLVLQLPGFRDGVSREVTISGVPTVNPDRGLGMIPLGPNGTSGLIRTTSTTGEISFRVVFGRNPGPAAIVVTVQELQAVYSIWFEVKPGAPHSLTLLPADTSIVLGDTYQQAARVLDRAGNDLNLGAQVTTSTSDPKINRSATNDITGTGYTRAAIRVHYGTLTQTAMVSIVPSARFAGTSPGALQITSSDGTELRRIETTRSSYGTAWTPDGTRVFYTDQADFWQGPARRIFSASVATGDRVKIIPDTVTSLPGVSLSWPSLSRDGQWLFFVVDRATGGSIWRARSDGSNAQEIVPPPASYSFFPQGSPSLSRDGSLLAYTNAENVVIRDMTTGTTRTIPGLTALGVRWSPVDDRLAIRGLRGIYTINADGTGLRTLNSDHADASDPFVDWSPDAKWLIVAIPPIGSLSRPTIVDAQTGMTLPLRLSPGHGISWAPN